MSKLIALSAGHGPKTPGKRTPHISEIGRYIPEHEFNYAVVKLLEIELQRCGFKTLIVSSRTVDTPLESRVNLANDKNADAYISIHYNALDGKFDGNDPEGHSVHIYPDSASGRRLGQAILKHLVGGTSQKNRGIVEQNLYETRKTDMVAVLSENGFMDNKREALLMISPAFQQEVAIEHAKGICDYFGVAYKPLVTAAKSEKVTPGRYRIYTGVFTSEESAEETAALIKAKIGLNPFIRKEG